MWCFLIEITISNLSAAVSKLSDSFDHNTFDLFSAIAQI